MVNDINNIFSTVSIELQNERNLLQSLVIKCNKSDPNGMNDLQQLLNEKYINSNEIEEIGKFLFLKEIINYWDEFIQISIQFEITKDNKYHSKYLDWDPQNHNNNLPKLSTNTFFQIINSLHLWETFIQFLFSISTFTLRKLIKKIFSDQNLIAIYCNQFINISFKILNENKLSISFFSIFRKFFLTLPENLWKFDYLNLLINFLYKSMKLLQQLEKQSDQSYYSDNENLFSNLNDISSSIENPFIDIYFFGVFQIEKNDILSNIHHAFHFFEQIKLVFQFFLDKIKNFMNELYFTLSLSEILFIYSSIQSLHMKWCKEEFKITENQQNNWNVMLTTIKNNQSQCSHFLQTNFHSISSNSFDNMEIDQKNTDQNEFSIQLQREIQNYKNFSINESEIKGIITETYKLHSKEEINNFIDKYKKSPKENENLLIELLTNYNYFLKKPKTFNKIIKNIFLKFNPSISLILFQKLILFWINLYPYKQTMSFDILKLERIILQYFSSLNKQDRQKILIKNLKYFENENLDDKSLENHDFFSNLNSYCNQIVKGSENDENFLSHFDQFWILSPKKTLFRLFEEASEHGYPQIKIIGKIIEVSYCFSSHYLIEIIFQFWNSKLTLNDKLHENFLNLINELLVSNSNLSNLNFLININDFSNKLIIPYLYYQCDEEKLNKTLKLLNFTSMVKIPDFKENIECFYDLFKFFGENIILLSFPWKVLLNLVKVYNFRDKISHNAIYYLKINIEQLIHIMISFYNKDITNHIFQQNNIDFFMNYWNQFTYESKILCFPLIEKFVNFNFFSILPVSLGACLNTKTLSPENEMEIFKKFCLLCRVSDASGIYLCVILFLSFLIFIYIFANIFLLVSFLSYIT